MKSFWSLNSVCFFIHFLFSDFFPSSVFYYCLWSFCFGIGAFDFRNFVFWKFQSISQKALKEVVLIG